ncbi:MAG: hypothetical protein ACI9Y8_000570 [Candidatus Omnitrophota bacterium]|jgi:hypothetical protein
MKQILIQSILFLLTIAYASLAFICTALSLHWLDSSQIIQYTEPLLMNLPYVDELISSILLLLGLGLWGLSKHFGELSNAKNIRISTRGEVTLIRVIAVREFIAALLDLHRNIETYRIRIKKKHNGITLNVKLSFMGDIVLSQEADYIRQHLKEELDKTFEFPKVHIHFEIEHIKINEDGQANTINQNNNAKLNKSKDIAKEEPGLFSEDDVSVSEVIEEDENEAAEVIQEELEPVIDESDSALPPAAEEVNKKESLIESIGIPWKIKK